MPVLVTSVGLGDVLGNVSLTDEGYLQTDVSIANGQTAKRVGVAIDVSALKAVLLKSDQAIVISTNDAAGGSPDQTLTLAAGVPFFWQVNSGITNPLTVDITDFYIANASGSTATLQIRVLQDATP